MAGMVPFNRNNSIGTRTLNNMLDDFFGDSWFPRDMMSASFKIDVKQDDKAYTIEAELPGIQKEEVNVSLHDGQLTIDVTRSEEKKEEDKDKQYMHKERVFSSMARSIYLGDAKEEGITAKLEGGILTIQVPKAKEGEKKKTIKVE